jgi:hypothetical protein
MPCFRPGDGAVDRPFTLLVPAADRDDAFGVLGGMGITTGDWSAFSVPATPVRGDEADRYRATRAWLTVVVVYGPELLALVASLLYIPARLIYHLLVR